MPRSHPSRWLLCEKAELQFFLLTDMIPLEAVPGVTWEVLPPSAQLREHKRRTGTQATKMLWLRAGTLAAAKSPLWHSREPARVLKWS